MNHTVVFSNTLDLVADAMMLLQNPSRRFALEQKGLQFMVDEQYSDSIVDGCGNKVPSALKLLSQTLSHVAGGILYSSTYIHIYT